MPSIEDRFREGLKDDSKIFDNRITLNIIHYVADGAIDFNSGTVSRTKKSTTVTDCLVRQASLRNGPSVPQLHQRDIAIQKDSFVTTNVVIEVPMYEERDSNGTLVFKLEIKDEDTIEDPSTGRSWKVLSVDYSTLDTRFRLGVTRLR
jgi:hypothetical protein